MAQTTQFTIGSDAYCTDGACGQVARVVVDPLARVVTHLVIEPKHRVGVGRLVPLDLVDATTGAVRLRCTSADFEKLERAEEVQFLPGSGAYEGYSPEQVLSWPYYGLGGGLGVGIAQPLVVDKVPLGEVDVRRGERVQATDGEIGRVEGLVVDRSDHHVTHVLLQEGHLWGRKEVAIPIGAVARIEDGIRLTITKKDVEDLPPVDVDDRSG
ncbi:MAG TPA: PRC-barrel domain-containing protein [Acidimicrobiales bacterium]|nr:PRC-barrel domain-containing protein [Acidimicrobiales bacterium]